MPRNRGEIEEQYAPPSPYGYPAYPGFPGYQAPAPRRGPPVWAVVLISVTVALVLAGGVSGALAALLGAERF